MASEDPDSRTSSVGKKRVYDELTTGESRSDGLGGISANDYREQLEKRRRRNSSSSTENGFRIGSIEAPSPVPSTERIEPYAGPISYPGGAAANDDTKRHSQGEGQVAISPAVTWNKGIPVPIRTSFRASISEKHPQAYQMPFVYRQKAAQHDQAVGRVSPQAVEASFAEGIVNASALPSPQVPAEPKTITVTVRKTTQENMPSLNGEWRWIFGVAEKMNADEIVRSLPESQRDLMPQQVADDSLFYTNNGRQFALPRLFVNFREMCFVDHQNPSFTLHFLNSNLAVIEQIDYGILLMAFDRFLGLAYGHLPKSLRSLLSRNNHTKSSGTRGQCRKAIADIRNSQRALNADHSTAELGLKDVKQKSSSKQEARPVDKRNRQADKPQNPNYSTDKSRNGSRVQPQMMSANRRMVDAPVVNIPSRSTQDGYGFHLDMSASKQENVNINTEDMMDINHTEGVTLGAGSGNMPENNALLQSRLSVDADELELLRKYYPADSTDPFIPRCLKCSDLGHRTSECPLLNCITCGLEGIHFTDACPQSQRCTRCRNRGHDQSRCPEKLAATPSEMLQCDICQSKNHLEAECHFLWRSFRPDSLRQKRLLEDIPVFCYCCGANTHFGSECGIRSTPLYAEGWTWSRANWERYVDLKSSKRVFSAGQNYEISAPNTPKKNIFIRGKAKQVPINDGDDDDVQFIGQKVKKPPPPIVKGKQKIKLAGKKQPNDESFTPRYNLRPPVPKTRQQPPRGPKPSRQPESQGVDSFNSYRPPNSEPARDRRERSFSPAPPVAIRVNVRDQYGDMSYRPDYDRDAPPSFRHYSDVNMGNDSLRGPDTRTDNVKESGGRDSGRGGMGGRGGTRAGRRKRKAQQRLLAASGLAHS